MNFHGDPVYGGDLHRADMAWAKHAAGCGMTLEQIKEEPGSTVDREPF
jgi:hypothetical protein